MKENIQFCQEPSSYYEAELERWGGETKIVGSRNKSSDSRVRYYDIFSAGHPLRKEVLSTNGGE